jgi:hypothetical protein
MKILNHPGALALGISTLCLLFLIGPLISPNHNVIYHLSRPATPLFIALGIDFCFVWLLIAGVLLLAERYRRVWLPVWLGIILFLPWIVVKNAAMLLEWPVPRWVMVGSFLLILGVFIGLLFLRRAAVEKIFLPVQNFVSVLLGFAGLAGLTILIQFGWCAWEARNLNPPFAENPRSISSPVSAQRRRVIWIVLDELSYQQVYERRFPGLRLPAFDRLADQSVVFAHVAPAGIRTERVLPALFTGMPADQIRASADGQLRSLRNPATGAWQSFSQYQTVFQDAHAAGDSTGIAGFYNPYCRILSHVLDKCFWEGHHPDESYVVPGSSWLSILATPLPLFSHAAAMLRLPGITPPAVVVAQNHIDIYKDVDKAADSLLTDRDIDFVLLHVPLPHPEGIYDRKHDAFVTSGASYIDNLALSDLYLAHVRQVLEQQGQWDSSVVAVMGDHSWRTWIWLTLGIWIPEDAQASNGGKFDDRPGYIVKMPMQENPLRVDTPFPALKTRALFDGVINGQLKTGQDLKAWAEQQR